MKKETIKFILAGIGFLMILNLCPKSALAQNDKRYKVAVADIMILKRQKIGAFPLTKELGADGVEVDMGGLGDRETFDNKLAIDSNRTQFLAKSQELNIQISSLAMTGFYSQSFAQRPTAVKAVQDCINTAKLMNVKVIFLPFGVQGDLVKNPELRPAIIERLKAAGKIAEQAGVTIGIETSLSAKDELQLLKDVGSPAVKSYFNFANAVKNNRDIVQELKTLGKNNIIQIHCTDDDGVWLQNDTKIDLKSIKQTLDKMGWSGWLVIERSRDASDPKNVKKNFTANIAYVKSIFQR
jgi:sugar phosphate isomerase/epimerase